MVVPCTETTMLLSASRKILAALIDHSQTELCDRLDSSGSIWLDRCFLHSVSYRKNSHSVSTKKKIWERDLNGRMDLHLKEVMGLDL